MSRARLPYVPDFVRIAAMFFLWYNFPNTCTEIHASKREDGMTLRDLQKKVPAGALRGLRWFGIALAALLATLSLCLVFDPAEQDFLLGFNGGSEMAYAALFVALCFCFARALRVRDARVRRFACIASGAWALLTLLGQAIIVSQSLAGLFVTAAQAFRYLVLLTGRWALYYGVLACAFEALCSHSFTRKSPLAAERPVAKWPFFLIWIGIFAAWFWYFLVYYPGTVSVDSVWQIEQALGDKPLNNHHAVMHTLLIRLFMRVGQWSGDLHDGVALYSLFQMLGLSALYAGVAQALRARRAHLLLWGGVALFYALFPVFPMYAITMWKDIPLGAAVLLLTLQLLGMVESNGDYFKKRWRYLPVLLASLLLIFMKNNGVYVYALCMVCLIALMREYRKPLLALTVVCMGIFLLVKGPVFTALEVQPGSSREALSIPLQTMARVVKYHYYDISDEDWETIDSTLPADDLGATYNWTFTDPVKDYFDNEYYAENKGRFYKTWLNITLQYPGVALDTVLCSTLGYWYPEMKGWIFWSIMQENPYELVQASYYPEMVEHFKTHRLDSIRNTPVLGMLLNVGFAFVLLSLAAVLLCVKRRQRYLPAFLPAFFLWCTALASPVNCEFRYIWGLYISLPLLVPIACLVTKGQDDALPR